MDQTVILKNKIAKNPINKMFYLSPDPDINPLKSRKNRKYYQKNQINQSKALRNQHLIKN